MIGQGGSGGWSEETNYNFILNFLWRAESKNNLDKYALFLFSGGSPTNPWDMSNPRSNFFSGGSITPFGKAYAAWDGDTTIHDDTPYVIHNRNARHRIRNDGANEPSPSWIRREDDSVQWALADAGGGKKYLYSAVDGRRLRYDGTTIDFAPADATGSEVEWTINREQYGWHNLIHAGTGEYLRLVRQNDANNAPVSQYFEMVSASAASGYSSTDWWFVQPWNEALLPDSTPPEIAEAVFNGDSDQSIEVSFSEDVNTFAISQSPPTITNLDTGQVLGERDFQITATAGDTIRVDVSSLPLQDGNWELHFTAGSFSDLQGNTNLDSYTLSFSVLAGDANGDLIVDQADLEAWRGSYGSTLNLASDWNRDGRVDAADYSSWRQNLGAGLVAPVSQAAAPALAPSSVDLAARKDAFAALEPQPTEESDRDEVLGTLDPLPGLQDEALLLALAGVRGRPTSRWDWADAGGELPTGVLEAGNAEERDNQSRVAFKSRELASRVQSWFD